MGLIITPRRTGDTVVLDLTGRLWILNLPLRDTVHALLEQECRFFVLNLERLDYIDSSGLGQLVSLWASVRTNGGNLALLRPVDRVRRLLKTTRLNVVFDIFQEEEKAAVAIRR